MLEKKRHCHLDSDGQDPDDYHRGCAGQRPVECGGEVKKATSPHGPGNPSTPSISESPPVHFGAMPYLCDECGRSFGVISEFVEHQIMHTRENLCSDGESFVHSVAGSEVQKGGGKHFSRSAGKPSLRALPWPPVGNPHQSVSRRAYGPG